MDKKGVLLDIVNKQIQSIQIIKNFILAVEMPNGEVLLIKSGYDLTKLEILTSS